MKIGLAILVLMLLVLPSGPAEAEPNDPLPIRSAERIVYMNPERLDSETFSGASWSQETVYPRVPMQLTSRPPYIHSTARPLINCSNASFRCLRSLGIMFAVPGRGLRRQPAYTVLGVQFKVEACYRGEGDRCQAALISASCRYIEYVNGDGVCRKTLPKGDWGPNAIAYVMYFFYNEDAGVTAFGIKTFSGTEFTGAENPGAKIKGTSEMRSIAMRNLLAGERGILAPPIH